MALTGDASLAPSMIDAVSARTASDSEFAATVDAAVERVLRLKHRMGLLPCTAPDEG
jgi:beta-N-acetylhexosaminidase